MNHPYSPCRWYFVNQQNVRDPDPDPDDGPDFSTPPSPIDPVSDDESDMAVDRENQPPTFHFPQAGKTFGYGANFMSAFDADVHAGERDMLPFYPFASKNEFELASWISRAGISMKLQDEFFNLKLVR